MAGVLLVTTARSAEQELVAALRELVPAATFPQITSVGSGEDALALTRTMIFDLVISDLVLPRPGLAGPLTLLRIRKSSPGVHTILYSDCSWAQDFTTEVADCHVTREANDNGKLFADLSRAVTKLLNPPSSASLRVVSTGAVPEEDPIVVQKTPNEEAASASGQDKPQREETANERQGLQAGGEVVAQPVEDTLADRLSQQAAVPEPERDGELRQQGHGDLVADKYRLGAELGRGGMGAVFRAEDTFIRRQVAIKLIKVEADGDIETVRRRMRREATISGLLDHKNIVTLHDAGLDGQQVYLAMELVEGRTLRDLLRTGGALRRDEAIGIALQILEALTHAHSHGVVHRDLKPANILLTADNLVKVTDFGIAKLLSLTSPGSVAQPTTSMLQDVTAEGVAVGTPAYMAPEQMRGEVVDFRADIYALGVVLFEMLRGEQLAMLIPPLARAVADPKDYKIPLVAGDKRLSEILQVALAVERENRYPSSEAFAEALRNSGKEGWKRFFRRRRGD